MTFESSGHKTLILIAIIGIGSTLPFNILMNATTFFSQKLDYKSASEELKDDIKSYSSFIVTFMGMASTLPNIFLQLYNAISNSGSGGVKTKLYGSITVQIFCLSLITGACFIDAVHHPYLFFYTILLLAFVLNAAGGLYQNLSFELAANLPMKYTNANITGSNLSGVISALGAIISMAVSTSQQLTSVIFFVMAILFISIQIFTANSLFKDRYYISNQPENNSEEDHESGLDRSNQILTKKNSNRDLKFLLIVFKECWRQLLNIFLTFFVSLIVFPAVQAGIVPINNSIPIGYFIAIFTFLNFNLFAMIGNMMTFWNKFPIVSKDRVYLFVLFRFLFIPFFLFCNYLPTDERTLPILIKSDTLVALGGALLGLSSGYFSSLGLMYAPKSVSKPEYAETAAKMGAFSLISGIFIGISSSFFLPYFVIWLFD